MKNCRLLTMMCLVMLIFQFCRPSGNPEIAEEKTIEEHLQEAMFIQRAAIDGMQAIALGQLAAEKAVQPTLKTYGAQMAGNYEEINTSLRQLAGSKGIKFPPSLPREEQDRIQQMREMKVEYFEKLYLRIMIQGLRKDITLFKGAEKAPDTAIVGFASKYLPKLEQQLQKALSLQ
ncbi:DUF4142 domain-containing protein [Pedobacter sp. PLR]|uniref:DUF4142 domain-containing protein n=1 Tax=Pedobacter sp. PLR TaxID=2994465 RepID=UPI0022456891|nr:DUF4142 domain-containing protein [Pedobacter sp. PLR]MCX2454020.1 DUF4142 domain-containing protein [Pedobacter sp. PLR]